MAAKDYSIQVDVKSLLNVQKRAKRLIEDEAQKMAAEVAEFGANEMRAIILTSGTPFSDAAREAGINRGVGRFRTGKMYNAVKSTVTKTGDEVFATYGWTGAVRKYFKYQEYGFRNKFIAAYGPSGRLITRNNEPVIRRNPYGGYKNTPGMFSLRDSAKAIDKEMPRFLKKYRARITRRYNKGER